MIEGEHYYRQFSTRNEDGARIQPDIVIKRPNGLSIVVDSKVTLTHYVRYCDAALTPDEERALRKEIYQSFKAHIDGLSGKKYDTIEGTADFVLMFTPAENAFTIAANHDAALRQYAFGKNVFVVTPSSLLLVIKMISDLWQKDRVNKEAHEIAARAKELYEKACGFLHSFAGVGAALDKARTEWDTASTRLGGNGGLVRQGEMLQKLLGTKTSKVLPAEFLARTAIAGGIQLPGGDAPSAAD
jgi:DNA recombination protein RmuC